MGSLDMRFKISGAWDNWAVEARGCGSSELYAPWMQDAQDYGYPGLLGYRVPRTMRSWSCRFPGHRMATAVTAQV